MASFRRYVLVKSISSRNREDDLVSVWFPIVLTRCDDSGSYLVRCYSWTESLIVVAVLALCVVYVSVHWGTKVVGAASVELLQEGVHVVLVVCGDWDASMFSSCWAVSTAENLSLLQRVAYQPVPAWGLTRMFLSFPNFRYAFESLALPWGSTCCAVHKLARQAPRLHHPKQYHLLWAFNAKILSSLNLEIPEDILSTFKLVAGKRSSLSITSSVYLGLCFLIKRLKLMTLTNELVPWKWRKWMLVIVLVVAIEINYKVIGVYSRVSVARGGFLTLLVESHWLTDFAVSFALFLVHCLWDWAKGIIILSRILSLEGLLSIYLSVAIDSEYFLIELSIYWFANAWVQVVAVYRAHAWLQ